MKAKVLFVDDDRYFTERYVRQLEHHFDVTRIQYAGNVFEVLDSHSDFQLIILDVMMPTPDGIAASATAEGRDTGLWLLSELRAYIRKHRVPVILYTNRSDTDVIRDSVARMNLLDDQCRICNKRSTPALELSQVCLDHVATVEPKELS